MTLPAVDTLADTGALPRPAPFLAWPGSSHLLYATKLGLINGLWFAMVFVGCDLFTAQRPLRVAIHTPLDLEIPFVPSMTVIYMSLYALFFASPFILRRRWRFRAAVAMLATLIGLSAICFLLIPAQLAYWPATESQLGMWSGLYHLADSLNLTYNLVPSLHVALTVACVAVFATRAHTTRGKVLLWAWAAAIALSTLFTHQHHILDVISGWLLALMCFRLVYVPMVRRHVARRRQPSQR